MINDFGTQDYLDFKKQTGAQDDISLLRAALVGGLTGAGGLFGSKIGLGARLGRAALGALGGVGLSLGAQAGGQALKKAGVDSNLTELGVMGLEVLGGNAIARTLTKAPKSYAAQEIDNMIALQSTDDELRGAMDVIAEQVKRKALDLSEYKKQMVDIYKNNLPLKDLDRFAVHMKKEADTEAAQIIDDQLKLIADKFPKNYGKLTKFYAKIAPIMSSSDGFLRRLGEPGEFLANLQREANFMERNIAGKWAANLAEISNSHKHLSVDDRVAAGKILDKLMDQKGKIDPERLAKTKDPELLASIDNIGVMSYAQDMRKWYNDFASFLEDNGAYVIDNGKFRPFQKKDFYYTHQLNQDELRKPETRELLIDQLMQSEKLTRSDAIKKVDDEIRTFVHGTNIGYLKKRKGIPPELRHLLVMDPQRSANIYLSTVSTHLAHQKTFGHNYEILERIAGHIPDTPDGGGVLARRYLQSVVNEYRRASYSLPGSEFLREVRAFATMTKMLGAQVANATQGGQTMAYVGAKNFAKALTKNFTGKERELLIDAGNFTQKHSEDMLKNLGLEGSSVLQKGAKAALKYSGFTWTEQNLNRNTAVIAGKLYLADLAKKITNQRINQTELMDLRKAGVSVKKIIEQGPTDLDFAKMGHFIERRTQFGSKINDLPLMWRNPMAKFVLQFKNFAFNQTKFMKDILKDSAIEFWKTGDIRNFDKLAKIGILTPLLSQAVMQWKEFLYNYDFDKFDSYDTAFGKIPAKVVASFTSAMGFGLASDFLDGALRGREVITPPGADPMMNIMGAILKFDAKPLSKISVPTKAIYNQFNPPQ